MNNIGGLGGVTSSYIGKGLVGVNRELLLAKRDKASLALYDIFHIEWCQGYLKRRPDPSQSGGLSTMTWSYIIIYFL